MNSCNLCKWSKSAPAGRYCVNPAIEANKVHMAVDGFINGMTPYGNARNDCEGLRTPIFGACGLSGKYFEIRTEPSCIEDDKIIPEGGDYVEWAKKCIANNSYKAFPGTNEMLQKYIQDQSR